MATSSKQPKLTHEIVDDLIEGNIFDHLPDEVQLKIVKFLEIEDLIRCAQVSKRTRRICHDESMWKKVNVSEKVVPSEFIEMILENGCKYINLKSSQIVGSLNLSRNDYDVKYLNLWHCRANDGVLEKLISSCQSLLKLSLFGLSLSANLMNGCNYQELQTLELDCFWVLDREWMKNILSLKKLTEVSFCRNMDLKYSKHLVQYLVDNLSSNVEKVNLAGIDCLTDEQVKTLVKRCKKIKELELRCCTTITKDSLTSIAEHSDQMVKLDITDTNIGFVGDSFLKVKSMPKLKVFYCGLGEESSLEIENLRKKMPKIKVNEDDIDIANPNESIEPEDELWDIFVKRIELFPKRLM